MKLYKRETSLVQASLCEIREQDGFDEGNQFGSDVIKRIMYCSSFSESPPANAVAGVEFQSRIVRGTQLLAW